MSANSRKNFIRLRIIVTSALFRAIGLLSNVIISLFIIRTESVGLWGDVVYYLILLDLGFVIINWGHSTYLLREFSNHPSQIQTIFVNATISRSLLLLPFIVLIIIVQSFQVALILIVWCTARFIHQAFDPLIQFEKRFLISFFLELLGILIIMIPIKMDWVSPYPDQILSLFAVSFLLRALIRIIAHWNFLFARNLNFLFSGFKSYFYTAFPFLLLTLSGMLQQRADLYFVAWFLPSDDTARYQVFLNLLLFSQLGASLLLSPFSKNIFRLSHASLRRLERRFTKAGLILTLFSTTLIYIIIQYLYQIEFSSKMYLMAYLYVFLYYVYLIRNYELGKAYKQSTAALYSFAGCAVNIVASYFLTPKFGLEGAICAGLLTQIFTVFLYYRESILKLSHAFR